MTANENCEPIHMLEVIRNFPVPMKRVWQAFADREQLQQWYCPTGMKVSFVEMDFREGGAWRSGMVNEEGQEHIAGGIYTKIAAPTELAFTHSWENVAEEPTPETQVSVLLREANGNTELVFRQTGFEVDEARYQHNVGWSRAMDQLAELLG